jgi:hypothetical protein
MRKGDLVKTSHGTGPYVIKSVYGPCTCASYVDTINMCNPPASESHFHIACAHPDGKGGDYCLNGYRADGTSVWSSDRLIFDGAAEIPRGQNFDLFAELESA